MNFQWDNLCNKWCEIMHIPDADEGFFETLKYFNNIIYFSYLHNERFIFTLNKLQLKDAPDFYLLCKHCNQILEEMATSQARLKMIFIPTMDNTVTSYLQIEELPFRLYGQNQERVKLGLYSEEFLDDASCIKSNDRTIYKRAQRYAQLHKYDDVLLVDVHCNVIESTISNVFIINDDTIITPVLDTAGINGVMKSYIISKIKDFGYNVLQIKDIRNIDIESADEIFLTNVIRGIRPVVQYMDIQKPVIRTLSCMEKLFSHNVTSTYV